MRVKNTQEGWGLVSQAFHWAVAFLVVGMLGLGYAMHNLVESLQLKFELYQLHKSLGFLTIILVLMRLAWRFANPVPRLPDSMRQQDKWLAHLSHIVLYGLLILMPLSGWINTETAELNIPTRIFGLFTLPDPFGPNKALNNFFHGAHEIMAWLIIVFVLVHILAALWHHFVAKDNILRRMLPFSVRPRPRLGSDA